MGIVSFGLSAPYLPRLGMARVAADAVGSLAAVTRKKGGDAEDWRFETGVIGIVLRTANPENRIHAAYTENELDLTNGDQTLSGRTSAQHELGWIGIGTPKIINEASQNTVQQNIYFCATGANGTRVEDTIFIELYYGIG